MTSHTNNTKHKSLVSNENSAPETSELTLRVSCYHVLIIFDKEMLNLKDVIIKDLQFEN